MALSPGTRFGAYEILGALGAGGMGEVYHARDSRLGRDVAIKVLPPLFANDPERLARFEREARTLAALNHPNIAHLHGLEEHGSTRALVMELVAGEDLAERLRRGAMPVADVLPIARQLADALEAAHEQGIVHRDLKPANIKLTPDGVVKILDFGLAKATSPDTSGSAAAMNSPTLTARATEMGLILGTAAYMAPEQARGKPVDRRADIWSFGVVLLELLTGERAFKGDDITEVLAKVIEREPDLARLPARTPPSLHRLIARCLIKDPKQRLRDMGEARIGLDDAQRELTAAPSAAAVAAAPAVAVAPAWRRVLPWALAALFFAALVVSLMQDRPTPPPALSMARMQITLPPGVEIYTAVGSAISVSPDATMLAFVGVRAGVRQVFVRRINQIDIAPVRGTVGAVSCIFSPDGTELLVGMSDTSLRRVRLSDGLIERVTPTTSEYLGGWLDDGRVVFTKDSHLWVSGRLPESAPTPLTEALPGPPMVESQPTPVVGAGAVLFAAAPVGAPDTGRIEVLTLADRQRKVVVEHATAPILTATDHLLFVREGVLLAAPFSRRTLSLTGDAVPVLRDLSIVSNRGVSPILTVSSTGLLVFVAKTTSFGELVWVSRSGREESLLRLDWQVTNPRLSFSGHRLVMEQLGAGLWRYDLERRVLARVSDAQTLAGFPIFATADDRIIYRVPSGMLVQPFDGSQTAVHIAGTDVSEFPSGMTADRQEVLFTKITPTAAGDIMAIPMAGGTPRVVLSTPLYEGGAQLSPDGKWLVYVSNEAGGSEVFLQPYPAMNRRLQVSSGGGIHPVWHPRGGEIFYRSEDRMMSVTVTMTPAGPSLSTPVTLFSGHYAYGGGLTIPNYAVAPDGERFVMVKEPPAATLNVVLNWFEELRQVK